jgi:gas vesicle protein
VLLATGHPTGVLAIHLSVATALLAAGAPVLVLEQSFSERVEGWPRPRTTGPGTKRRAQPDARRRRRRRHGRRQRENRARRPADGADQRESTMAHYEIEDGEPFVVIEKSSGGLGSFFWGLVAGAGIALLFAPQSGADTRYRLKLQARRAKQAAQDIAEDVTDTVVGTIETARRTVEDRVDAARDAVEIRKRQVTRAVQAGRAAAQDARDELERRIAETKAAYQAGADVAHAGRTPRPAAASSDGVLDLDDESGV